MGTVGIEIAAHGGEGKVLGTPRYAVRAGLIRPLETRVVTLPLDIRIARQPRRVATRCRAFGRMRENALDISLPRRRSGIVAPRDDVPK
jgi:hypothetical protein